MTDEKRIEEIRAKLRSYNERNILGSLQYVMDVATLLDAYDAERARAVRAEAERDRAMTLAEREVADALVRSKERVRRVYWTDYTTGELYETGGDWPASEISIANEVCGFFRMLRMWTLEMRANRAEADRDARPAITPELAIRFLAHETDPGVFRKVTDAVADFGTAMVERAAKSRPSPARCEICDWPLHDTIDKGCTAESCSYRPEFGSEEHRLIAARRKEIAAKAEGGR